MTMTADYFTATEAQASVAEDHAVVAAAIAAAAPVTAYCLSDAERADLVAALSLTALTIERRVARDQAPASLRALYARMSALGYRLSR